MNLNKIFFLTNLFIIVPTISFASGSEDIKNYDEDRVKRKINEIIESDDEERYKYSKSDTDDDDSDNDEPKFFKSNDDFPLKILDYFNFLKGQDNNTLLNVGIFSLHKIWDFLNFYIYDKKRPLDEQNALFSMKILSDNVIVGLEINLNILKDAKDNKELYAEILKNITSLESLSIDFKDHDGVEENPETDQYLFEIIPQQEQLKNFSYNIVWSGDTESSHSGLKSFLRNHPFVENLKINISSQWVKSEDQEIQALKSIFVNLKKGLFNNKIINSLHIIAKKVEVCELFEILKTHQTIEDIHFQNTRIQFDSRGVQSNTMLHRHWHELYLKACFAKCLEKIAEVELPPFQSFTLLNCYLGVIPNLKRITLSGVKMAGSDFFTVLEFSQKNPKIEINIDGRRVSS